MFLYNENHFPFRWKCHHSAAELQGHQENHLCCLQCQNGFSKLCEVRKIVSILHVILKLFLTFFLSEKGAVSSFTGQNFCLVFCLKFAQLWTLHFLCKCITLVRYYELFLKRHKRQVMFQNLCFKKLQVRTVNV